MLLAAIIILILLGLALIAIGLRGRVVLHGPTCRACVLKYPEPRLKTAVELIGLQ